MSEKVKYKQKPKKADIPTFFMWSALVVALFTFVLPQINNDSAILGFIVFVSWFSYAMYSTYQHWNMRKLDCMLLVLLAGLPSLFLGFVTTVMRITLFVL
ncbi:MAG: hypothetical protein AAFV93_01035 [Chloroflexota bacterium]